MSAPMKRHRTEAFEVVLQLDEERRYLLPRNILKQIMHLLDGFEDTRPSSPPIPWSELAGDRIAKLSAPGLAIRGARVKEGLTQIKLAEKLDVTQANLSKMETGTRPIGKAMALRLSKALRMDYRVFL